MYRENIEETFETNNNRKIIIVCNNGKGIKDFKILFRGQNFVKVRYTLIDVKAPVIHLYQKSMKIKKISQIFYVLDLESKKILRVPLISKRYANFFKGYRKPAIELCCNEDINIKIESQNYRHNQINAYDKKGNETTAFFLNLIELEGNMPDTAFFLDFQNESVQKIKQIIFLN